MADEIRRLFDELGVKLHEQKQSENKMLDDIAGKVFDAYRAALGDDFTTQEVIRASTYGSDIRDWNSIEPEMQDTLWALGVRHPESVDRERASSALSDGAVEYLRGQGLNISDEQAQLFPTLMKGLMQGLEEAGVKFSNEVKKARILGLKPLVDYREWLVNGGQFFMDPNKYNFELKLTDNAIKANQNVLTTALVSAGDIKVNYGIKQEILTGIVTAEIKTDAWSQGSPFVVAYETKGGTKGKIDVLKAALFSLTEEADKNRLYDVLQERTVFFAESESENLGYQGSIEALVGLTQDISQELRANIWRKHLKSYGIDFSQNAEAILVGPTEKEKITFFYGAKDCDGQENGVAIALRFDERYGHNLLLVCTRDKMQQDIARANNIKDRFNEADYRPLLEPMAVHDYIKNRRRLTPHQP